MAGNNNASLWVGVIGVAAGRGEKWQRCKSLVIPPLERSRHWPGVKSPSQSLRSAESSWYICRGSPWTRCNTFLFARRCQRYPRTIL
ncbi:hypothetical protein J6590_061442 [Homalodisca vitripennis]|nr:hypothetical protein J6590_061442 [Homalodisca vitripennis]